MATVDFAALLSRGHPSKPARVARIAPREALRPAALPPPAHAAAAGGGGPHGHGPHGGDGAVKGDGAAAGTAAAAAAGAGGGVVGRGAPGAPIAAGTASARPGYGGSDGAGRLVYALDDDGGVTVITVSDDDDYDGCAILEGDVGGECYDGSADGQVLEAGGTASAAAPAPAADDDGDAAEAPTDMEVETAEGTADEGKEGDERRADAAAAEEEDEGRGLPLQLNSEPSSEVPDSTEEEEDDDDDDDGDESPYADAVPIESLPGRPTVSFRRADADARLAALLAIKSSQADEVVRLLATTTREYARHVGGERQQEHHKKTKKSKKEGDSAAGGGGTGGLASLIMPESNDERELLRRLRLERSRVELEATLPSQLHEVELGDWERGIDWDGAADDSAGGAGGDAGKEGKGEAGKGRAGNEPVVVDPQTILSQPFNPNLDSLDFGRSISWLGCDAPPSYNHSLARSVPLLLEKTVAGRSVALNATAPPVRPESFGSTAVYEARYERELSSVATSTATSLGNTLHPDSDKLEAIIKARQARRARMAVDKSHRVMEALGTLALGGGRGRTITSSLMGPGGTERTGRPARHAGSTSAHDAEYVEQIELVYNHILVKPDLRKAELRQFHRPRLPRSLVRADRPWQFQIKVLPTKHTKGGAAGRVTSADGSTLLGSYNSMVNASQTPRIRNESDLSPSEGNLVLFEYCEERPPVQLPKGHAVRIVNYYRGDKAKCPISAGGGDRPTRKRHHGDKAGTGPDDAGSSGKAEKPPRLRGPNQNGTLSVRDLVGDLGGKKKKDSAAAALASADNAERHFKEKITVLPDGVTEILHPKVHGPFIGEVEEGTTQTGLISNLFAAPMFRHDPEPTDFLMILGKKPSRKDLKDGEIPHNLGVTLRPLPANIYTIGQTEPRVKVFAPNTTGEKNFTTPFVTYQIAKALENTEQRNDGEGLRFDEINERLFANTPIPPNALRQRIKQVARYDKNTQFYTTKPIGFEDYPGVEALGRRFSPEGVAAYESACAAVRRLCDLGIHGLYSGSSAVASVGAAMVFLTGSLNAARERKSKMAKMLEFAKTSRSKTKARQIALYEKAAKKLEEQWKEIRKKQEVARFIFEELQLAPWHLTAEFVDVHKQAQGTGMMRLTGLGDPSGRGEAYNYLREVDAKPNKGTGNSDGALNAQIKKITGTENDLRKLTMKQMASLLRSYGMGQKEIDTLKRWDRVHVIRDLSTKAASDGMGDGLERYARGEKMKLSDQKRMYQERIQEIWRRQRAALSTDAGGSLDIARGAAGDAAEAADDDTKDSAAIDKQLQADMQDSDSDSDDDDDLAAAFEEDFMDVQQTNQLVAAQIRGSDEAGPSRALGQRREDTQEMSKDARELAALKRQREEERAAQERILGKGGSQTPGGDAGFGGKKAPSMAGRKVVRRRVIKTHPDGTQTTTFKFIVNPVEVEKIIAAKKVKEDKEKDDKKKKGHRGTRHKKDDRYEIEADRKTVGHSMFEDDDEDHHKPGKIKLQVSRRAVGATKKKGGVSKAHSKLSKTPKLQGGKLHQKVSVEKRKKKRRRELEEADLYSTASKRMGTSNRRERGSARERMPHVIFADRLEAIRATVEQRPGSGPFHRPVNRRAIPRYYEVISEPIDLQTIRDKNQRYEYRAADSFVKDFELMKNNAIKFNGIGSLLGNEATAIYDYVKKEVADNRDELDAMEEAVEDQLSGSRKRKKTSRSPKSPGSKSPTGRSSNKTDVVLDGIKTTVDLGDITAEFNFDGVDSDSDDSVLGKLNL